MNGPQDLGGFHGFGKIPYLNKYEPVFDSYWEGRVFSMSFATFIKYFPVDETRYAAEKIKPNIYLNSSYYERWLLALEILLIENNLVTKKEIIERENQIKKNKKI